MFPVVLLPYLKKALPILLGAAIVFLYGQWQYYKGEQAQIQKYEALIKGYSDAIEEQKRKEVLSRQQLVMAQDKILAESEYRLLRSESRKQQVVTLVKTVKEYVSEKADSSCDVPVGAVWLLDHATAAERPGDPSGVPESKPADVDASSGVALSGLIGISAENLSECVARGEVIRAWQDWYEKNSREWQDYRDRLIEEAKKAEKANLAPQ